MDALLLALLLGLALDQGDRSQRLVRTLDAAALAPVCLIVILGASACAVLGAVVTPYLKGSAGLLFFALTLVIGALGLLLPGRSTVTGGSAPARYARLALHRLADASSFLLIGVSAMTGNVWATALGGAIGGLGALLPPLLAGAAYERLLPLRIVRPVLGGILLIAGLACALMALGLL